VRSVPGEVAPVVSGVAVSLEGGASEAVRVACSPRTAGAGGTIRPRLGRPKVGSWMGPTRGSRANPKATSPM
jgi:hypothetical protein